MTASTASRRMGGDVGDNRVETGRPLGMPDLHGTGGPPLHHWSHRNGSDQLVHKIYCDRLRLTPVRDGREQTPHSVPELPQPYDLGGAQRETVLP
jgi:hypothetical protein